MDSIPSTDTDPGADFVLRRLAEMVYQNLKLAEKHNPYAEIVAMGWCEYGDSTDEVIAEYYDVGDFNGETPAESE